MAGFLSVCDMCGRKIMNDNESAILDDPCPTVHHHLIMAYPPQWTSGDLDALCGAKPSQYDEHILQAFRERAYPLQRSLPAKIPGADVRIDESINRKSRSRDNPPTI